MLLGMRSAKPGIYVPPVDTTDDILLEDGSFLLLESGDKLLLE